MIVTEKEAKKLECRKVPPRIVGDKGTTIIIFHRCSGSKCMHWEKKRDMSDEDTGKGWCGI